MKTTQTLFSIATMLLVSHASAKEFFVSPQGSDSTYGTKQSPFRTIEKAISWAKAGDVIYVRGGTYLLNRKLVFRGGTLLDPITITAYPKEKPIVDCSALRSSEDPVIAASPYFVVQGLEFRNSNTHGLSFYGTHDITIKNCVVRNAKRSGIYFGYQSPGVSQNFSVIDTKIINCVLNNSVPTTPRHWPPALAIDDAENVLIQGCTVSKSYGEGIGIRSSANVKILNNTVFDDFSVGIYLDASSDTVVNSNFIYSTGDRRYYRDGKPFFGIYAAHEARLSEHPRALKRISIQNNIISNTKSAFAYGDFGRKEGLQHVQVSRNTFYNSLDAVIAIDPNVKHKDVVFTNNIFAQTGQKRLSVRAQQQGLLFDSNCWSGGNQRSLVSSRNDYIGNPLLTSPTRLSRSSFRLRADSPLVGKGIGASQP